MRYIESEAGLGKFSNDSDKAKAGLANSISGAAKTWRERYGDIDLPAETASSTAPLPYRAQSVWVERVATLPSKDQLVEQAQKVWKTESIAAPSDEFFDIWSKALKEGFPHFQPVYYKDVVFTADSNWLGKGIKPNDFFWRSIKDGYLAGDAAALNEGWALFESVQRPKYRVGKQMYGRDERMGSILKTGRKEGKIHVPDWCKHVPDTSRAGVSADEVDNFVIPEVAKVLRDEATDWGVPRAIEFNMAGNLYLPKLGDTNTWELFGDKFGHGRRLIGGYSVDSGLAFVGCNTSGNHLDNVGFRLQRKFPSKA